MSWFHVLTLILSAAVANESRDASPQSSESPSVRGISAATAELVLSGPAEMPLFRKGHGVTFHAVLINRSNSPLVFVRPHPDWPQERQLQWGAVDTKGRSVDQLAHYYIWCDVHGVMRAERRDFIQVIGGPPKPIQDSDVVLLQPGEQYEIAGLADPSFWLHFLRRDVYQVSLSYTLDSSRYELPKASRYATALKSTGFIGITSKPLSVRVN